MGLKGAAVVFLMSLTGIPVTYLLNNYNDLNPFGCFACGAISLLVVTLVPYLVARNSHKKPDNLYYMLGIFMFGCVVDIVIALENDGFVSGFTAFYINVGEKYFRTSHGTMLLYWDGTVQYGLYMTILAAITYSQSYREVGLYWSGSIINSMLILVPSGLLGEYGVQWSFLLNIPYMIIPICACVNFWQKRPKPHPQHQLYQPMTHIWERPLDLICVLYLISAACFAIFRGLTVLGCKSDISVAYLRNYEPYLGDPSMFPRVQMLVYMFYFVPYYIYAAYSLIKGGDSQQLSDLSLIHAGASAQGQFSHMGASLHSRTPFRLRVPPETAGVFFLINGALFIVPHLLLLRTNVSDAHIEEARSDQERSHDEKLHVSDLWGAGGKRWVEPARDEPRETRNGDVTCTARAKQL